jgi:hypothetical protein
VAQRSHNKGGKKKKNLFALHERFVLRLCHLKNMKTDAHQYPIFFICIVMFFVSDFNCCTSDLVLRRGLVCGAKNAISVRVRFLILYVHAFKG